VSSIVALPPPARLSVTERLRGRTALGAARVILAMTAAKPAPLTRVLTGYATGARPATQAEALRAWRVVTTLSPRCGSDTHCLPRSIAIALYLRMAGVWPTWRTGVRFPPLHSHAWVEAAGRPVGEPEHLIATYTPTTTITAMTAANTTNGPRP
jgi:hypothetical protein